MMAAVPFNVTMPSDSNGMLKGMGWREGEGLGRRQGGITAPVEAQPMRKRGMGVGLNESTEDWDEEHDRRRDDKRRRY